MFRVFHRGRPGAGVPLTKGLTVSHTLRNLRLWKNTGKRLQHQDVSPATWKRHTWPEGQGNRSRAAVHGRLRVGLLLDLISPHDTVGVFTDQ